MGTRSLTVIEDEGGDEIVVLYRQMDGYPRGHGVELADFLSGHRVVNGYTMHDNADNAFNGMGCCAARIVAHFKGGEIGNFYLWPAGTRDCGEEFIYHVTVRGKSGQLRLTCEDTYDGGHVLFDGDPEEFAAWLEEYEKREAEG